MCVALTAKRLGSAHKEAIVFFSGDIFFRHRRPETRPTGSRIKLGIRAKQLIAAAAATVDALLVIVPILTSKSGLRAFLPGDVKLLVCQLFLPLGIVLFDPFHPSSPSPRDCLNVASRTRGPTQLCMLMNWSGMGILAPRSI